MTELRRKHRCPSCGTAYALHELELQKNQVAISEIDEEIARLAQVERLRGLRKFVSYSRIFAIILGLISLAREWFLLAAIMFLCLVLLLIWGYLSRGNPISLGERAEQLRKKRAELEEKERGL